MIGPDPGEPRSWRPRCRWWARCAPCRVFGRRRRRDRLRRRRTLITYNTNTVAGAASGGPQAFARVLTGFNYHGPDGQVVGDRDFGTISVVGRAPLVLDYQINDNAVYSDGKPITCDDMVLAWAAQSGRFPGFDAASRAGYGDVAAVDCAPGQKKARVTFAQDRGVRRLRPAVRGDVDDAVARDRRRTRRRRVTTALQTGDGPTIDRIAAAWNTTWNLSPDLDLKRFPSSGPYKLDSVTKDGAVVLVANDKWWGAKPVTRKVIVWPRGADIQDRVNPARSTSSTSRRDRRARLTCPTTTSHRHPVGRHRTAHLRAGGATGRSGRTPRGRAVHAPRRHRPQRRGADRQHAGSTPRPRTRSPPPSRSPKPAQFNVANPHAAQGGDQRTAADRAHRVSESERATGRDGRHHREVLRRRRHHRAGCRRRTPPARRRCATTRSTSCWPAPAAPRAADRPVPRPIDAYDLHTGNGNNLSGYSNERVDGVIGALAVTADPKDLARLLGESAPVLWGDMPTLPLYRQQRTLLTSTQMFAVSSNPTRWGAGWNMDRWELRR